MKIKLIKEITSENVNFFNDEKIYKNIKPNKICNQIEAKVYQIPSKKTYTESIIEIKDKSFPFKKLKENLLNIFKQLEKENELKNVGINGFDENDNKNFSIEDDLKGSIRFSTKSSKLAKYLTKTIKKTKLKELIIYNNDYYEFVNVSKYFRVMFYNDKSTHYPHYDSNFNPTSNDDYITLYSVVMYVTKNQTGEIAFIDENSTEYSKEMSINKQDWSRQAVEYEIFKTIKPNKNIVCFPHTLCHSVLPFEAKNKQDIRIIFRGDLIFKKVKNENK